MVGVDVGRLNRNETRDIFGGWAKSFSQKLRDDLNQLSVQARESLEILHNQCNFL
jgi:hypothetical protein